MRKYIHIAKAVTPVLTEEAANHIAEEYSRLRSQEQMGTDIARVSRSLYQLFYYKSFNIKLRGVGHSEYVRLLIYYSSHPTVRPLQ